MGTLIAFWLYRACHFFIFNRAARDSIRPLRHKKNGPSGDQPLRPLGPRGQEPTADPSWEENKKYRALFALRSDCVSGFAVNGIVAHLQRCIIHAQRDDHADHLKDDVGDDRVVNNDERGPLHLQ